MVSLKYYAPMWGVGFLAMAAFAFMSWLWFSQTQLPPVKYLSIAVLTRNALPGSDLVIRTTADVRKQCPGKVDRYIIRLQNSDETLVYHDKVIATPRHRGESISVTFSLPLPATIEPGNYIYRAFVGFDCNGDGKPDYIIAIPEASFRVCNRTDLSCDNN